MRRLNTPLGFPIFEPDAERAHQYRHGSWYKPRIRYSEACYFRRFHRQAERILYTVAREHTTIARAAYLIAIEGDRLCCTYYRRTSRALATVQEDFFLATGVHPIAPTYRFGPAATGGARTCDDTGVVGDSW